MQITRLVALISLLLSGAAIAQSPTTPGLLTSVITNDTVTGTTVNKLAKLTVGKAIIAATTDTDGAIGVVLSGAGLSGSAQIATNGVVNCAFDGTATAGDYVQISASVAGDCTDTTSSTRPTTGQVIGRVITGGTGAGSYKISLQIGAPGFIFGTGVITALGVNVGTAGSMLVNGGVLGTPSSGTATNLSGTAASLTAGHVTTNANMTGDVTSVGNATTLATGNAGNLNSGTLLAARMPAFTGDCTTSAGAVATTCTKSNGVSFSTAATVLTVPTRQVFISGTAATYTRPTSPTPIALKLRMCGGGGGGGGSGTAGTAGNGGNGTATTFSTFTANFGSGAGTNGQIGGAGGAAPALSNPTWGLAGAPGETGGTGVAGVTTIGASGGNSPFFYGALLNGSAVANTGAGGSGGNLTGVGQVGGGGGAGSCLETTIPAPATTYTYTVGAFGAGGTLGTSGAAGNPGSTGTLIVDEIYQ